MLEGADVTKIAFKDQRKNEVEKTDQKDLLVEVVEELVQISMIFSLSINNTSKEIKLLFPCLGILRTRFILKIDKLLFKFI